MIPTLPFGRTGHISTRVLFGAAALSRVTQAEADKAVETLMKYGGNHIDTSESYGDSELLLGPWMAKYRDKFFLATKTDGRTYQAAKESIQRSLERLRTDSNCMLLLRIASGKSQWAREEPWRQPLKHDNKV
jgi:aryl-alcohol dehydrogenase-like predicted oxidoreductase